MGGVTSVPNDTTSALFLRDPARFFISSILVAVPNFIPSDNDSDRHIIGAPGSHSLVLPNYTNILESSLNTSKHSISIVSCNPNYLVEYVQVYYYYLVLTILYYIKLTRLIFLGS